MEPLPPRAAPPRAPCLPVLHPQSLRVYENSIKDTGGPWAGIEGIGGYGGGRGIRFPWTTDTNTAFPLPPGLVPYPPPYRPSPGDTPLSPHELHTVRDTGDRGVGRVWGGGEGPWGTGCLKTPSTQPTDCI